MQLILSKYMRIVISLLFIIPLIVLACLPLEIMTTQTVIFVTSYMFFLFVFWAYIFGPRLIVKSKSLFTASLNGYRANLSFIVSYELILCALILWKNYYGGIILHSISVIIVLASICFLIAVIRVSHIIAKSLVSLELNKDASVSQVIGTLMQVILFPICIWFVYGRVQKALN
jgi:hypothetical protein